MQNEPGTQNPMRPTASCLSMTSGFTATEDTGVDWTDDTHLLDATPVLAFTNKVMDDKTRWSISGGDILLGKGIFEVEFTAHLVNDGTALAGPMIAITDGAGVVLEVSDVIGVIEDESDVTATIKAIVENTSSADIVNLRVLDSVSGAGTVVVQPAYVGKIRKIGNDGEAGPA